MEKFWYLASILVAILITFALGVWAFSSADDVATAIGPVITALATIGAAIFGISVGREAGKSEGHEEGAKTGRKEVAAEVMPHLEGLSAGNGEREAGDYAGGAQAGGAIADTARLQALEQRLQQIINS
jgi:hypothetical protein